MKIPRKSKESNEPIIFGRPNSGAVRMPYKEIHHHSLAIIRNIFEETPDKYLLYFDERWQCRLFLNWKSKENQEEDLENIKKQLSAELQIDAEAIQGQLWFEQVHEKYSVSADKNKWYHHSFYEVQISEFPDWVKQPDFEVNGKHFYWMSIAEMEADPRIMEVNADIIGMVKEQRGDIYHGK